MRLQPAAAAAALTRVYPNPTDGRLTLKAEPGTEVQELRVLSMVGQTVLTMPSSGAETELDLSALPAGLYLLQAQTPQGTHTHRVVRR